MSNSLWPHGLQHARLPCPSVSPGVCSNSCPLSQFSSVQLSCSVMSDSLQPHGRQHTWLLCPTPTPIACSNSCPLSRWCYPTISSSVIPFSSCLQSFPASGSFQMSQQSFPASGSFQMSQLFAWGGQRIGVSASASVLPMNTQNWSPLAVWLDLLAVQVTLKSLLQHHSSKASTLWCSAFFMVQLSHPYTTTGKNKY